ncbi:hypothetical protein [Chitinimonas sp.]|uniref:hypothetical protein n=1 Tax=Chitinimonas sp. TaxID=1934313 RepID=UPI0035B490F7
MMKPPTPTGWHSLLPGLLSLLAACVFMLVAAALYWPTPEAAFRTDDSPVAWLSSAQLWAMAILCLRLWQERALPRLLCLWLALAMMAMAFDEQFMLHEHWKYQCIDWLDACRHGWVTELPMLLVAVLGTLSGVQLHRALRNPCLSAQLGLAILCGLFALYLRFTQQPAELLPYKAALLVIAEALFLGCLLGLRR